MNHHRKRWVPHDDEFCVWATDPKVDNLLALALGRSKAAIRPRRRKLFREWPGLPPMNIWDEEGRLLNICDV